MPRRSKLDVALCPWPFLTRALLRFLLIVLVVPAVQSKDVPLTAIELYDGPNGAAFVQLSGLLINGKAEVRSCAAVTEINKSNYGKLPKITLSSSVASLERDAQGTMTLTRGTDSECVVPANLKFEKDGGEIRFTQGEYFHARQALFVSPTIFAARIFACESTRPS